MHFLPSDEQRELQRGVREVLDAAYPLDKLPGGFDAGLWSTLVETGVFSLRTELELGFVEASLVFEELGRAAVPGPLVGTFIAAGRADAPVTVVDPRLSPILVAHLAISQNVLVLDPAGPRLANAGDLSDGVFTDGVDGIGFEATGRDASTGLGASAAPAKVMEGSSAFIAINRPAQPGWLSITFGS